MAKKLSESQWQDILRRHIVDGVGSRALALEYSIPESSIRTRAKSAHYAQIEPVAKQMVEITGKLKSMNSYAQTLTCALAQKLGNISHLTADVAELEAKSGKQLASIKAAQILNLDPENLSRETVGFVKILGEMVNDSMKTPLNLINSNRETLEREAAKDVLRPKKLADFYADNK